MVRGLTQYRHTLGNTAYSVTTHLLKPLPTPAKLFNSLFRNTDGMENLIKIIESSNSQSFQLFI
jgi:hypothetical protein